MAGAFEIERICCLAVAASDTSETYEVAAWEQNGGRFGDRGLGWRITNVHLNGDDQFQTKGPGVKPRVAKVSFRCV